MNTDLLAPTYARSNELFVRGAGCTLTTADGRDYLDMTSGIAVLALGHASPVVAAAVREAADGLLHLSNLFHSEPPLRLAAALCERSFADRVFFANSGAESVEAAIKFARLAGGAQRRDIVYFDGSFHGRTLGALAATDRPAYREPFEPLPGGFTRARFNDHADLARIDEHTAAAIVEPIQGEAGVREADDAWLVALRARCDAVGALLIVDEIQCGLGRTGELWAHSRCGIRPDLMTLAKPLGGGLPIGAVLLTRAVSDALAPGCHGTTFGGNPFIAHVALRVLQAIAEPELLAGVRARGEHLRQRLTDLNAPCVREVRGRGLMLGLHLSVPPGPIVARARELGLLVVPAADQVIRLLPPLDATRTDLDRAVELLGEALLAAEVPS